MKVSVIISAHQAEPYISACLDSVFNQTLEGIEIIVINNGSTDQTGNILDHLALCHPNLKVLHQNETSIPDAKYNGFLQAQGDYVYFMDSDDSLYETGLSILYDEAIATNADLILCHAFCVINNQLVPHQMFQDPPKTVQSDPLHAFFKIQIQPNPWNKLIKRSFIINNNIEFPSQFNHCEDVAFCAALLMNNPTIQYVRRYLYCWYIHKESTSANYYDHAEDVILALDYIIKKMKEKEIYEIYKDSFKCYTQDLISYILSRATQEFQMDLSTKYNLWLAKYQL